jgi:integrase
MASRRDEGQMIQRAPDKWLLRVYLGSTEGKKTYLSKTVRGTTAQARQELRAMLNQRDSQTLVRALPTTTAEYLDAWLEGKIDISPRTRSDYTQKLAYSKELLGKYKLQELNPLQLQFMVTELVKRGLSPRTVEFSFGVLRAALSDAVDAGLLAKNPCKTVRLPKKNKRPASVLSNTQVNQLLESTQGQPLHPLWRLLLTTGLRPQEALALKWDDIDLEKGWLQVNRTLVSDGTWKVVLSDTVKADSRRQIGLPSSTVDALKAHKLRQNAQMLLAGAQYERQSLIFASALGHILDHNRVRRMWKKALRTCGLPPVRLYDTRHSHLTALLADGADIAWVASRAGHKDIKMTRDHYAHVLPEVHRKMADMTERMLQQAQG